MISGRGGAARMISGTGGTLFTIRGRPARTISGPGVTLVTIAGTPSRMVPGTAGSLVTIPGSPTRTISGPWGSLVPIPGTSARTISGTGGPWIRALEASIPTSPLAAIVAIVKILVIVAAHLVIAPLRILALEIIPVLRMGLIPGIPPRRIPVPGSDDIDLRIGVVRGESNFRAEKVVENPIYKPVALVKGPGRIIPHIGGHDIALSGRRSGHRADRAPSQQNYQQQKSNAPLHDYPHNSFLVGPMISGLALSQACRSRNPAPEKMPDLVS